MISKTWGDFPSEGLQSLAQEGDWWVEDYGETASFAEPKLLFLLPSPRSDWVIKKVAEVKRRLGYSFHGMKQRIEDIFWEIKRCRSWSPRRWKKSTKRGSSRKGSRELKNLHSDIHYNREKGVGREEWGGGKDNLICMIKMTFCT